MGVLTDLQILGCELHKNAFGCRAPPGPAGRGSYSASPDTLRWRGRRKGEERVRNREARKGGGDVKGGEGWEEGGKAG